MGIYTKTLVIADIDNDEQLALDRAMQLAAKGVSSGKVCFFLPVYDFSYDMTSMLPADERDAMRRDLLGQREQWMHKVAKPYLNQAVELEVKVAWHNLPHEAIIAEVVAGNHDIVIKGTRSHDVLDAIVLTPTDLHLWRKCPSHVLLAEKNTYLPLMSSILASIHVGSEDDANDALNDSMVGHLNTLTEHLGTKSYLINACSATGNTTIELPEFDPNTYTDAVLEHHRAAMKAICQKHGYDEQQTIVELGQPEDVIAESALKLDAAMVIVGAADHVELPGTPIGPTAESIISKIKCDMLVLKPKAGV